MGKHHLLLLWALATPAAAATFQGLGDLAGSIYHSTARGVSGDGSTVVGTGNSNSGQEACIWTAETGLVGLGDLPGPPVYSFGNAASFDGSVIVGTGRSGSQSVAFRWTASGGMVDLGHLSGSASNSSAQDVSADGSVVVGWDGSEAFRWTSDAGMAGLGHLDEGGALETWATGVSADGGIVVGAGFTDPQTVRAFRWTPANGMQPLACLEAYLDCGTQGVSADGTVVVGTSEDDDSFEAFRWTESGGPVGLGDLQGGTPFSSAGATNRDGSIVVGIGTIEGGLSRAFIWDASRGMRRVDHVLENDYGLDLDGWQLTAATAISDDGDAIAGFGLNPSGQSEAWIAMPEPTSWLGLAAGAVLLAALAPRRRR